MSAFYPPPSLSATALQAFGEVEAMDWETGVPLTDLLNRVNRVALQFHPEDDGRDSRVSRVFAPRSFRHYQTLGAIDAPARDGQRVVYGFRHFVQALVVRRLLWEKVPAETIAALLAGRGTEETKRLLSDGVAFVARQGAGGERQETSSDGPEVWRRVPVAPGIELHVRDDVPKPRPGDLRKLVERLEGALRRSLCIVGISPAAGARKRLPPPAEKVG